MKKVFLLMLVMLAVVFAPAFSNRAMAQSIVVPEGGTYVKLSNIPGVNWPVGLKTHQDSLNHLAGMYAIQQKEIANLKAYNRKNNMQINGPAAKKISDRLDQLEANVGNMQVSLQSQAKTFKARMDGFDSTLGLTRQEVAEMKRSFKASMDNLHEDMIYGDSINYSLNTKNSKKLSAVNEGMVDICNNAKFYRKARYQEGDTTTNQGTSADYDYYLGGVKHHRHMVGNNLNPSSAPQNNTDKRLSSNAFRIKSKYQAQYNN